MYVINLATLPFNLNVTGTSRLNDNQPGIPTMLAQRSLLRASQRVGQQIHSPVIRSSFQRRLASSSGPKLSGPADNAFNRERQAVKEHAAATSGTVSCCSRVDQQVY